MRAEIAASHVGAVDASFDSLRGDDEGVFLFPEAAATLGSDDLRWLTDATRLR
jgi:hypothetical protein